MERTARCKDEAAAAVGQANLRCEEAEQELKRTKEVGKETFA